MSTPIKFIAPRIPITDPDTGMLTRQGVLFFQDIFNRIGGATGYSTTELAALIFGLQASETTSQPQQTNMMFPDLVQPVQQSVEFADIMQGSAGVQITEVTFQ